MTATVDQYTAFIVPEHQGQPNFEATVSLSVKPFVDEQNAETALPALFDLDVAVGDQLDAVGVRVGRTRFVDVPLTGVYFAWDTPTLGWDQGYWQGPLDPDDGVVALDDATYRLLLRAVIIANSWGGTVQEAAPALMELFNGTTTPGTLIFIEDHFDMTMTIGLAGQLPPAVFQALLAEGAINLKPVGVAVNYTETSVDGSPIFGWDVENSFVSGWDVGAWGVPVPA